MFGPNLPAGATFSHGFDLKNGFYHHFLVLNTHFGHRQLLPLLKKITRKLALGRFFTKIFKGAPVPGATDSHTQTIMKS